MWFQIAIGSAYGSWLRSHGEVDLERWSGGSTTQSSESCLESQIFPGPLISCVSWLCDAVPIVPSFMSPSGAQSMTYESRSAVEEAEYEEVEEG